MPYGERMPHVLGCSIIDDAGCTLVHLTLDGTALVELVRTFETAHGFDDTGNYGGAFPESFLRPGPDVGTHPTSPDVEVLDCGCSIPGCWPLATRVTWLDEEVTWSSFRNAQRPERDYSGFGPFVFERTAYESALATAATEVESRQRQHDTASRHTASATRRWPTGSNRWQ